MTKKVTFEDAYAIVMQYIKSRKWDKTNDSRVIAVSLSLEANAVSYTHLDVYKRQAHARRRRDARR